MDLLPLRFEDVGRAYGRTWALRGIDLEVRRGTVVGLWGPNGAGKTTMLRIAAGLEVPSHGCCTWAGDPRRLVDPRARGGLGWMAHGTHLYPWLSAEENLALLVRLRRSLGLASADPRAALERVGLEKRATEPVRTFSRGMAQRLSFARVLVGRPQLVLLDEPMTALDASGRRLVTAAIHGLVEEGAAVLLSSHDPEVHASLADRVVCLEQGRVRARVDRAPEASFAARLSDALGTAEAPVRGLG